MTWLVVIVFFVIGYWIVSALTNRKPRQGKNDETEFRRKTTGDGNSYQGHTENGFRKSRDANSMKGEEIGSNWYRILGVPEDAAVNQIAAAYKLKISQYHPDKVAQMGAEIREVAELKSKQINNAYDYALKLRRNTNS